MLTHLSLFSGIGGLDLAAEAAGFVTVAQCECAEYPLKVLERHWPGIARFRDVRMLTKERFYARTGERTVDIISGGFPCQPHSLCGKRLGGNDSRDLWPEFIRVVRELKPRAVVGENVPGILSTIHEVVCADLEGCGYQVRTFCIPAFAVGAHHERYRVAIVAYAVGEPGLQANKGANACGAERKARETFSGGNRVDVSGLYWATNKPPVCGMADGIPGGVDGCIRHKAAMTALGNAVVPQQFYPIFKAIFDHMKMEAASCS